MKPEDKVVEEVVAYFSEPKFSEFSIIRECQIQMGVDNRSADIVLRDIDGNFTAIAECNSKIRNYLYTFIISSIEVS